MAEVKVPIEEVRPGATLGEDIYDPAQGKIVYTVGTKLTAGFINHILTMDHLEITILEEDDEPSAEPGKKPKMPLKTFKPGDYICLQGEKASHIYILKEGTVQIIVTSQNPPLEDYDAAKRYVGERGKVVSHIKGKNIKFGEMASVLDGFRSASVKCTTDVKVVQIKADEKIIRSTIQQNHKLGISLAFNIGLRIGRIRKASNKVITLHKILIKKIASYHKAFEKIEERLKAKCDELNYEWLKKIVKELKSVPALSGGAQFKPEEVTKTTNYYEMKSDVLPSEMESFYRLNTDLTKIGKKENCFFVLKKGRVQLTKDEDERIEVYDRPGCLLNIDEVFCKLEQNPDYHLKCISPVRLYKIPMDRLDDISSYYPALTLFICKAMSQYLIIEDQYQYGLLAAFERDLNRIAVGDANYRRGFKKLTRVLEKFTKEEMVTETERKIAETCRSSVDNDYAWLKEELNKLLRNVVA
jgi:CRP-like cAMP-binding protein